MKIMQMFYFAEKMKRNVCLDFPGYCLQENISCSVGSFRCGLPGCPPGLACCWYEIFYCLYDYFKLSRIKRFKFKKVNNMYMWTI